MNRWAFLQGKASQLAEAFEREQTLATHTLNNLDPDIAQAMTALRKALTKSLGNFSDNILTKYVLNISENSPFDSVDELRRFLRGD